MKLAIMQPYFLPYIGYYQLISAADVFVVYDNIKYTKRGWINRNRMSINGTDSVFSIPLKKDSDALNISERELAAGFDREKFLNQFRGAYSRAPHFSETFSLLTKIVQFKETNLFRYLHNALLETCTHLRVDTEIRISSEIDVDQNLKGQDRVLAICQALGATTYLNAIGGTQLYSREAFSDRGLGLHFIKSRPYSYTQFGTTFIPWLSIIDVMMFDFPDRITHTINGGYDLI